MRVPFRLVDVFTDHPLAGNQLCVIPEGPPLDDATMLALAREIGFSETTFVSEVARNRYRMRIFTPDGELPFASHPTLGTAFVLAAEGRIRSPAVQVVAAGEIPVEVDLAGGTARMRQLNPTFGPDLARTEALAAAVGLGLGNLHPDLPPQVVSTGLPTLLVPAGDASAVARARRDAAGVRQMCLESGGADLYLFALTDDGAKARMFDPGVGIGEDAATGSAAGPLGAYLAERGEAGMPGHLDVVQGEEIGRPSVLHVEVQPDGTEWAVTVGGGVRLVGEGAFDIP